MEHCQSKLECQYCMKRFECKDSPFRKETLFEKVLKRMVENVKNK